LVAGLDVRIKEEAIRPAKVPRVNHF
jgi:hypothetical protein